MIDVVNLRDDALPVHLLMTSQQDKSGEDVGRHHIQVTEKLGEQLRDLRERVLQATAPTMHL